jgi:nitrate reductase beta subunit
MVWQYGEAREISFCKSKISTKLPTLCSEVWFITTLPYLQDNGNAIFDDSVSILELSSVSYSPDWSIDEIIWNTNIFVENVLTYISGFIMRTIINKEKCTFCYTYLKESRDRVTCPLITTKQLGGLIYPITDVITVVKFANRNVKLYYLFFLFIVNC